MQRIIAIGVIGFICIAYPVMLFICICKLPWYIAFSYFVWLILSLITIIYSKKGKWYEKTVLAFMLTLIFTIVLSYGISNSDEYLFTNNNIAWYIAPALNLPAIYWIGKKLQEFIQARTADYIKTQQKSLQRNITDLITEKTTALAEADKYNSNTNTIFKLLKLIKALAESDSGCDDSLLEDFVKREEDRYRAAYAIIVNSIPSREKMNFPTTFSEFSAYKKQTKNEIDELKSQKQYVNSIDTKKQIKSINRDLNYKDV